MPRRRFVLNNDTYFSPERPHLSNSQISDYLKSPEYYYRRHVEKSLSGPSSVSLRFGSIVDAILSGEKHPYEVRVLKRDDPERFEIQKTMDDDCFVSETVLKDAEAMAHYIKKQNFWHEYSDGVQRQVILEGKIGQTKVCGKLDILDVSADGKTAYVDDLKTAQAFKARSKDAWIRTCFDYGYLRQLAFYRELVKQNYKTVEKIVCRHIVGSKIEDGLYKVQLFTFSDHLLDTAMNEVVEAVREIQLGHFTDPLISWSSATHVVGVSEINTTIWNDEVEEQLSA